MSIITPQKSKHLLRIEPDGTIRFLWDDALAPLLELGESGIARASHVEPQGALWFADLHPSGGPRLGPFALRGEALQAERDWLILNRL